MSFFTNLKLAVRLGIAFGALALALVITAAVSFNGLNGVDADAHTLSDRDVAALMELVTISEDFLATDGDVVRHLYLEDGDLKAQDKRAEKIVAWTKEANETLANLEPLIESERGQGDARRLRRRATRGSRRRHDKAVELSRQETIDGVEERDGSRTLYTGTVLKELEGLDVIHDEIEGVIEAQAHAQAEDADATAGSAERMLLIAVAIALLVAGALAFLVTRSVTKPVAALADRLRSLNDHCLEALTSALEAMRRGRPYARGHAGHRRPSTSSRATRSAGCLRRSTGCSARRSARSSPTTRCASSSAR